jgi:hypothetical protein
MKTLLRSIAILFVFLGAVIVLQSPQPTKADWPCDLNGNADAEACANSYRQCVNAGVDPNECAEQYQFCLMYGREQYDSCVFVNGESPNPWPVINEHRAWCNQGCQTACDEVSDPAERFYCRYNCMNWCNETYPKP